MKGRCPTCDELLPITGHTPKIPHPRNDRALDYFTEAHAAKDKDKKEMKDADGNVLEWCPGAKKAIL